MDAKTYQFNVKFKEVDGIIIATVPALPGCVSYGNTIEEAESNIQEAITCHVESILEDGEVVPVEEKSVNFLMNKSLSVSL